MLISLTPEVIDLIVHQGSMQWLTSKPNIKKNVVPGL